MEMVVATRDRPLVTVEVVPTEAAPLLWPGYIRKMLGMEDIIIIITIMEAIAVIAGAGPGAEVMSKRKMIGEAGGITERPASSEQI